MKGKIQAQGEMRLISRLAGFPVKSIRIVLQNLSSFIFSEGYFCDRVRISRNDQGDQEHLHSIRNSSISICIFKCTGEIDSLIFDWFIDCSGKCN